MSRRRHRQRHRPHRTLRPAAFSFTELLFAVMILGIGFIMIAAIFPVAIRQQELTLDETQGLTITENAGRMVEALSNSTYMATNYALPDTGGTVKPFPGTHLQFIRGDLVVKSDPRYAWVAAYAKSGTGTATLYVWALRARHQSRFELDDFTRPGVATVKVDLLEGGDNNPDEIDIKSNPSGVPLNTGDAVFIPFTRQLYTLGAPASATRFQIPGNVINKSVQYPGADGLFGTPDDPAPFTYQDYEPLGYHPGASLPNGSGPAGPTRYGPGPGPLSSGDSRFAQKGPDNRWGPLWNPGGNGTFETETDPTSDDVPSGIYGASDDPYGPGFDNIRATDDDMSAQLKDETAYLYASANLRALNQVPVTAAFNATENRSEIRFADALGRGLAAEGAYLVVADNKDVIGGTAKANGTILRLGNPINAVNGVWELMPAAAGGGGSWDEITDATQNLVPNPPSSTNLDEHPQVLIVGRSLKDPGVAQSSNNPYEGPAQDIYCKTINVQVP